ncbi:MAG: hypothetical protein GF399_06155 [Candidatus Coatesbacteria bacterium]|nr:hypothetical protein [Candidatus Coatesbacteria bacterium]
MKHLSSLTLAVLCALLLVAACEEEAETTDEGETYSLVEPTLDKEAYQLGDLLNLSYEVANPTLDPDTGEYDVYVNLDVTRDGEPYDAYPQIEHVSDAELPLKLNHAIELNPDVYLPGDYDLKLMVTNRVQDQNETLEQDLSFTIEGPPQPPTPTEGPGSNDVESETATH